MIQNSTLLKSLEKTWKRIERLLNGKGFKTILLDSDRSLRKFIYDTIPDHCIVGLGASLNTSTLKIRDILVEKGNKVYYNWNGTAYNRSLDTFEEQPRPDYFLTTAEIIVEDGKVVNHEYSKQAVEEYKFPKNIIAFSELNNKSKNVKQSTITKEYNVFSEKLIESEVTVAILPFASAS
jgi:hypothetical protein